MNREIYEVIKKHHLHPISYQKKKKVYIINDNNHSYAIKLNTSNYDIYRYLLSRDFDNFPSNYNNKNDNYDILEYIDDNSQKEEQKLNDLIMILAKLHKKTSFYKEIDLDEIKKDYEDLLKKINNVKEYYLQLNDLIDKEIFLSPSMYLLVRNISLIYYLLDYADKTLNEWYIKIKDEKKERISLTHNNISLEHLIVNENHYLISWDKACFNSPIYDLIMLYRKYYNEVELSDVLHNYEKINPLSLQEKRLLYLQLAIPKIINITNDTYDDTQKIDHEISLLSKVYQTIKKEEISSQKK